MEDLAVRMRGGTRAIKTVDPVTLARRVGVAVRGKHDGQRGTTIPFGFRLVERAVDRAQHEIDEIGFHTHHHVVDAVRRLAVETTKILVERFLDRATELIATIDS